MGLARKSLGVLIEEKRRRVAELDRQVELARSALNAIEADREAVVAREAAGDLSPDASANAFEQLADRERRQRADIDRLPRVADRLRAEIGDLESELQADEYAKATAAYVDATEVVVAESLLVAKSLHVLVDRLAKIEKLRTRADEFAAAAVELQPDGADPLPQLDEPEWLDAAAMKTLIADLRAGPRRPAAERRRAAADAETYRNKEVSQMKQAVERLVRQDGQTLLRVETVKSGPEHDAPMVDELVLDKRLASAVPVHLQPQAREYAFELLGVEEKAAA